MLKRRNKPEEVVAEVEEQEEAPRLRRRVHVDRGEYPRGGHVPNPPDDCPYKMKFEQSGGWWTNSALCGFHCRDHRTCRAFKDYKYDTKNGIVPRTKTSED